MESNIASCYVGLYGIQGYESHFSDRWTA